MNIETKSLSVHSAGAVGKFLSSEGVDFSYDFYDTEDGKRALGVFCYRGKGDERQVFELIDYPYTAEDLLLVVSRSRKYREDAGEVLAPLTAVSQKMVKLSSLVISGSFSEINNAQLSGEMK